MLGALLSLVSAFSFSVNAIFVRRGMAGAGATATQGAFITVLMGVPLGLVAVMITGQLFRFGEVSSNGYLLLAAAGIVHFGIGRYCNYRAVGAIGAPRAITVQAVAIPYSVLMAIFLLGEQPTALMLAGIGLILLGPAVMVERRKSAPSPSSGAAPRENVPSERTRRPIPQERGQAEASAPPASAPPASAPPASAIELRQVEGYTFALFAAAAYGTSPLLIRAALEDATRTAAIGTFVAYVGAAAVLTASLALPGQRQLIGAINLRYMRLFGGAGVSVFLAQLFRFFALSLADVTVVNPLQRMSGVFTLILTYLVNRSLERLDWRVVTGVMVSFVGSALLVYGAAVR